MARSSRTRRLAAVVAGTALAAGAVVATASPAQAGGDGHDCGYTWSQTDDGALNELVHHALERVLPGLHATSCSLQVQLDELSCFVPLTGALRSSTLKSNPFACYRDR